MIRNILIKEIKEYILSTKILVSYCIILLLFVINIIAYVADYGNQITNYHSLENSNNKSLQESSNNLHDLVFLKQKISKSPSALSFIAKGEERLLPNGIELDFFLKSNPQSYKPRNNYLSSFTSIDCTNILLFFLSFICISFSYNAFSGEKRNGTLKLMLSNPLPRWKIIIGKYLGILCVILLPFIFGIFLMVVSININPNISLTSSEYQLILLFLFIGILFISFNTLIGLFISASTTKPIVSISMILTFWIFFNIVMPNLSWLYSKKKIGLPAISKVYLEEKHRQQDVFNSKDYSFHWKSKWIGNPPNNKLNKRAAGFNEIDKIHNELWGDYWNKAIQQTHLGILVSKLSPYSVFRYSSEVISDNGFYGYNNFYNQIKKYHVQYKDFIINKDKNDNNSHHLIWNERWSSQFFMSKESFGFHEIPKFTYKRPSLKEVLFFIRWDLFLLLIWNIILFLLTFIMFIRYDAR